MLLDCHAHNKPYSLTRIVSLSQEMLTQNSRPQGFFSAGVHPWEIKNVDVLWEKVLELTLDDRCLAIGETGIDRLTPELNKQIDILMHHFDLAQKRQKPILVHCVRSHADFMEIGKNLNWSLPIIWHDFKGHEKIFIETIKHFPSSFFSLSPRSMRKDNHFIPHDRLLIESDEFLDVDFNNHLDHLASQRKMSLEEFKGLIHKNCKLVFNRVAEE